MQSFSNMEMKREPEFNLDENESDITTTFEYNNYDTIDLKHQSVEIKSCLDETEECVEREQYQIKTECVSDTETDDTNITTEERRSIAVTTPECIKSVGCDIEHELPEPTGYDKTSYDKDGSERTYLSQAPLPLISDICTVNENTCNIVIENTFSLNSPNMSACDTSGVCSDKTTSKNNINEHELRYNSLEDETYKCDACKYKPKYKGSLNKHVSTHLNLPEKKLQSAYQTKWENSLKTNRDKKTKTYKCSTGDFKTKFMGNLDKRMPVHLHLSEKEMYKCNLCDYTVELKLRLNIHKLIHKYTSDDIYTCDRCLFKTKWKEMFTKHIVIHIDRSEITSHKYKAQTSSIPHKNIPTETSVIFDNDCVQKYTKKTRAPKRRTACPLCFNDTILHFPRHLFRHHKDNSQVKLIHSLEPKSKERVDLLSSLRKQGSFRLKTEKNILRPVRISNNSNLSEYFPCRYCLGHYSKKFLYRHMKLCKDKPPGEPPSRRIKGSLTRSQKFKVNSDNTCLKTPGGRRCLTRSQTPMPLVNSDNTFVTETSRIKSIVFDAMKPDEIRKVAQADPLICSYGEKLLRKDTQNINFIVSNKVREMARLLIAIKKIDARVNNLFDCLKPKMFRTIVEATKVICGFDVDTNSFKAPSLALHMGNNLKILCDVAVSMVVEKSKFPSVECHDPIARTKELQRLKQLISAHWRAELSNLALEMLSKKRLEKAENCLKSIEPGENVSNVGQKSCNMRKMIIGHVRWSEAEKVVVKSFFSRHIKEKIAPKKRECEELMSRSKDTFVNKDWVRIKTFVYNVFRPK